jgi:hypothetical protein
MVDHDRSVRSADFSCNRFPVIERNKVRFLRKRPVWHLSSPVPHGCACGFLDGSGNLRQGVRHLGAMLGLPLGDDQIDEPLTANQPADVVPGPHDPHSAHTPAALTAGRGDS